VIVFDDNQQVRDALKLVLQSKGYEVFVYADPASCPLQHAHDCPCSEGELCADIILTDIDMPSVSGLDFIESQTHKGCKIQNIGIMSGAWSDSDRKRAEALGCTVLEKPVSLSILRAWLNDCADRIDRSKALSDWFRQEPE